MGKRASDGNGHGERSHMRQVHDEIPPGRLLSLGPRPSAVARGRERVRAGGVPPEALAAAIIEASALLRAAPAGVLRRERLESGP